LYDFCVAQDANAPRIRAWRPQVPGVAEVLHAHMTSHVYPMHTHESWTLLIVDDGMPPSEAAAAVGFYDQAHLNRTFKRLLGTSPGRFASGSGIKPAG
jgi:AraC-like DNA-binding protein